MSEFGYHVSQVRGKPDWTVWGNIPQAKLWQCVFLSLDLDPGNPIEDEPIWTHTPAMFDDHERRLSVARAHAGPGGLLRRGPGSPATGSSEVAASGRKRISLKNFVDWSQTLTPPWPLPAEMLHLGSGPVQEPDMNAQAEPDWQIVKRYRHASLSHLLGWACGVDIGKLADIEPLQRHQILKELPLKQWQQLAVSAFHDPRKVFFAKATGEGEPLERVVEVAEFRAWARSVDFELPPDFPVGDDPVPCERGIEQLNRPGGLNYSPELDVAFHAWKNLYADGQKKPRGGPRKQIMQWLDQHCPKSQYPALSRAARERIATMINPWKEGGVTATL